MHACIKLITGFTLLRTQDLVLCVYTGLFGTFGSISRLVLPPSKVLALVEYSESSAAVKAFR